MRNLTWSGIFTFIAVAAFVVYLLATTEPTYQLVQPDAREKVRGRMAPRLDANECIQKGVQANRVVKPIASRKIGGVEVSVESGSLVGPVSKRGPRGAWPAELDVRRFLQSGIEGVPRGDTSGTVLDAVIVDTFGTPGGGQKLYITTQPRHDGAIPDAVAETFMTCMLERGYTVQKMKRDWKSWLTF